MQEHREHHVERERVAHITGHHEGHRDHEHVYHRARGGGVHSDEAEDRALVKGLVKSSALKAHGGAAKHRADKAHRAKGGRVKKNKGTVVNVNVAPQQSAPHPMPMPLPGGSPGAGAAPLMPPRPPMAPPPGGPPGMPPGMMPHASGGRVGYKTGGAVFSEKIGKMSPTGSGSGHGAKVKTPKNAIYSPAKGDMAPKFDSGAGGGVARLEMAHRAAKNYHKTPPARHTP
jgi:hypothetical protein